MSLATDILKALDKTTQPKPERKPRAPHDRRTPPASKREGQRRAKTKPPEPRKFGRTKAPVHVKGAKPCIKRPDVYYHERSGGHEAKSYDGSRRVYLGTFPCAERAYVAVRLYNLWRRRGFDNIPTKTSRRLYTKW